MAQLPSLSKAGQEGKVCRLHKALYGLKQGGSCWYLCVCEHYQVWLYVVAQLSNVCSTKEQNVQSSL